MNRLLLFLVLATVLFAVGIYVFRQSNDSASISQVPSSTRQIVSSPEASPLPTPKVPTSWKTYTSEVYNFSIRYPEDIIHDTNSEGERFYKHGPSQSQGTELYDGILVLIRSGSLENIPFAMWVERKYEEVKNDPLQPRMGEKKSVTIAGKQGFIFTVSTLGERAVIYLPKGDNEYLEINNGTVEPQDREQTFQKTVDLMLSTITY